MFNGYETEELVDEHIKALIRELQQQEQVGNQEAAEACRKQLRLFGQGGKAPAKRAERRSGRKGKPEPAAAASKHVKEAPAKEGKGDAAS